jgi:glycosyltransferase involved in cell wall biosynthesis
MPSYNHGRFLPFAIESALSQSQANLELIIFDDGSTDGSYEKALDYAAADSRVRVLAHPNQENHGIGPTVTAAAEAALGDYVCLLPADDTLFPDSVARRVSALCADPKATFAYGLIEMLDEDGTATGRLIGTPLAMIPATYGTADPLAAAIVHNYMPGHSVLVRRSALTAVGGYDPRLLYSDWHMAIKLHAHGRAAFVSSPPLAGHRAHAGSMSLVAPAHVDLDRRLAVFRVLDGDADRIGGRLLEPPIRALVSCEHAYYAFAAGYTAESRSAAMSAVAAEPEFTTDITAMLWWLTPHQQAGRARWLLDAFTKPGTSAAALIAQGARQGHFASWIVDTVSSALTPETAERLQWAVIANELEGTLRSPSPVALGACLAHVARKPHLLREKMVLKAALASMGLWRPALKLRARVRRMPHGAS